MKLIINLSQYQNILQFFDKKVIIDSPSKLILHIYTNMSTCHNNRITTKHYQTTTWRTSDNKNAANMKQILQIEINVNFVVADAPKMDI